MQPGNARAVEGHAEGWRRYGEDLMALIIGSEEALISPWRGAAIEIVLAVEDDILRPLDLAQTDDLHIAQPVVQTIGRVGRQGRGRRRELQIGRRDIDLGEPFMPVAQPAHVDENGGDQHAAEDGRIDGARDAEIGEAVGQDQDQCRPHRGLGDGAAAAAERIPAQHRAVRAATSSLTPASAPMLLSRAAKKPAREQSTPDQT